MTSDTWSVRLGFEAGYRLPEHEADQLEERAGQLVDEPAVATTERGADLSFWIEGKWTTAAAAADRLAGALGLEIGFEPVEVSIRAARVVAGELVRPSMPELLGATEVGELLEVSRQRVHQLKTEHPDFPAPLVEVAMGPLWDERAITRFARDWNRRPGRRPASAASSQARA